MDIICDVLKQYYMLDEKEEKNMKKKIKDCLKNNKTIWWGFYIMKLIYLNYTQI